MQQWANGQKADQHFYALDLPASTVRGLFDQDGDVTQRYGYGPFGEPQSASGSTGNPLRFAARELDATTGLYYVRARWYDPSMGRFISEDPIGLAGGINNYAYALNDPVNLSDPTGLCPPSICLPPVVVRARSRALNQMRSAFLSDRWSGIHGDDGVTHTMSGVASASSPGWQDAAGTERSFRDRLVHVAQEVAWGECTADLAGLVLGAVAGKMGKMAGNRAFALRNHADDLYRVGLREVQDIPSFRAQAMGLYRQARTSNGWRVAAEFTQVGATLVGVWQLGSCIKEQW